MISVVVVPTSSFKSPTTMTGQDYIDGVAFQSSESESESGRWRCEGPDEY